MPKLAINPSAVNKFIETVPDYPEGFLHIDGQGERTQQLLDTYPRDRVAVRRFDNSVIKDLSESIDVIIAGDLTVKDPRVIMVAGEMHVNELIGVLTADFCASRAAERPDLLQALGYDIMISIPTPDRPGYALQYWIDEPFTINNYMKGYFRTHLRGQLEWTFPSYPRMPYVDDIPQNTKVLMRIMEEYKPLAMGSLHNSILGNAYFNCYPLPGAFVNDMRTLVEDNCMRMRRGDTENAAATEWAPGLYRYPRREEYIEKMGIALTPPGSGSHDYLYHCNNDSYHILTENPYFDCEVLRSQEVANISVAEVCMRSLQRYRRIDRQLMRAVRSLQAKTSLVEEEPRWYTASQNAPYFKRFVEARAESNQRRDDEYLSEAETFALEKEFILGILGYVGHIAVVASDYNEFGMADDLRYLIDTEIKTIEAENGPITAHPLTAGVRVQAGATLLAAVHNIERLGLTTRN